ncbi:MAG: FHA domain-containing protein [Candidatus Eisenbacteria bacterium]
MIGTRIRIEVLDTETQTSQDYELEPGPEPIQIGRDRGSDVILGSPSASRRHCEIQSREDGWFVRDLSTLGTTCNGAPVSQDEATPIRNGDLLECANFQLRITITQVTDPTLKPDPHAIRRLFSEIEETPPSPRLWLFADATVEAHELPEDGSVLTIGRGTECNIRLADPHRVVSAVHARVERNWAGVFLYDASRNGIYVNGTKVEERHVLADGDRITVAVAEENLDRPLLVFSGPGVTDPPPGPGAGPDRSQRVDPESTAAVASDAAPSSAAIRGGAAGPDHAAAAAAPSVAGSQDRPRDPSSVDAGGRGSAGGAEHVPPAPDLGGGADPSRGARRGESMGSSSTPTPASKGPGGLVDQLKSNLLIVLVLVVSGLALLTVLIWGIVLLRG